MSSSSSPTNIAQRWTSIAVSQAQSRGYTFTKDCLSDLNSHLTDAAARLESTPGALVPESYDSDVRRMVDYMIEELEAQTPGDMELHEWTLSSALWRFCPLFPFC